MNPKTTHGTGLQADENSLRLLGTALNRYCLSLTRSNHAAEDLAQDTWVKALGYGKFIVNPNPEALLLRIAKNTWIDLTRRQTVMRRVTERESALIEQVEPYSAADAEMAFQVLMELLPPLQRCVILLRDVLGYSAAEAAKQLHTSEGAVKAALHRARAALKKARAELAAGDGPSAPADADERELLAALAGAYTAGQVPVMLELLKRDQANSVTMAVGRSAVQETYGTCIQLINSGSSSMGLRMAA